MSTTAATTNIFVDTGLRFSHIDLLINPCFNANYKYIWLWLPSDNLSLNLLAVEMRHLLFTCKSLISKIGIPQAHARCDSNPAYHQPSWCTLRSEACSLLTSSLHFVTLIMELKKRYKTPKQMIFFTYKTWEKLICRFEYGCMCFWSYFWQ